MPNKKILIIGQAPPLQKQEIPYDTTMLYEWLSEIGIDQIPAQAMFDFEAMTDKLPSVDSNGHKPPTEKEMWDYFERKLRAKINNSDKIILLGACPRNFFGKKNFFQRYDNDRFKVLSLIHPSKRNFKMYKDNKEKILSLLRDLIYNN